jgi:hypothetical protein
MIDITDTTPVARMGAVRKADIWVVTNDDGVYALTVTEARIVGKMITVTAQNFDNPAGGGLRFRQSTHRLGTPVAKAMGGWIYRRRKAVEASTET